MKKDLEKSPADAEETNFQAHLAEEENKTEALMLEVEKTARALDEVIVKLNDPETAGQLAESLRENDLNEEHDRLREKIERLRDSLNKIIFKLNLEVAEKLDKADKAEKEKPTIN